jgi:hypothetical protein
MAAIGCRPNGIVKRRRKARPSRTALEFRGGVEKRLAAACASEGPGALFLVERARTAVFRSVLAQDVELFGRERLSPIIVVLLH